MFILLATTLFTGSSMAVDTYLVTVDEGSAMDIIQCNGNTATIVYAGKVSGGTMLQIQVITSPDNTKTYEGYRWIAGSNNQFDFSVCGIRYFVKSTPDPSYNRMKVYRRN